MNREKRGQGHIYQRGAVWWVQYCFRGERYRESSRSERRTDAVRLLQRRMGEMSAGRVIGPATERTTFENLAAMIEDDYAANFRPSRERLRSSLKHLRAFFGLSHALDITADRLTAYVRVRQKEGAAQSTIRNELAALKRAFSLAIRAGHVTHRPPFPCLVVNNARAGFFERGEFERLRGELAAPLRPVVTFGYLTGWRKREVLGLQWRHVDFGGGVVRLEPGTTKNREGRTFPFAALPELADVLRAQRKATTEVERRTSVLVSWVFHRDGKPVRSFDVAWRAACTRANVPGRIFHDFRRTAVRNLERAGVPRSVAMQLTGHKTEAVYRRYAIVAEADLREGVEKLARLAGEPVSHNSATIGAS